jgi:hypothetical protein
MIFTNKWALSFAKHGRTICHITVVAFCLDVEALDRGNIGCSIRKKNVTVVLAVSGPKPLKRLKQFRQPPAWYVKYD